MINSHLVLTEEVADALAEDRPVISMESTLITHGLPYPQNVEVSNLMDSAIREAGVAPATIAIIHGRIHVGLSADQLEWLATQPKKDLMRCSRRNVPVAIMQRNSGATTVAGTMFVSNLAGIKTMTTGAIGGVHRMAPFDVSADLVELGRTPVTVVASGVKPFLDLKATKEVLETQGALVIGLNTDDMAPFFDKFSGAGVDVSLETPHQIAQLIKTKHELGMGSGMLVSVPVPDMYRYDYDTLEETFSTITKQLHEEGIWGPDVTTWMIKKVVEHMGVKSVLGNIELLYLNATVAAEIASKI